MSLKTLWRAKLRVVFSVLCAGIAYSLWMGAFLLSEDFSGPVAKGLLWIMAPVATGLGFGAGVAIHERITRVSRGSLPRTLIWPLAGCAVGALAVYWYGPMLIVFGMFAAGTCGVALREVVLGGREDEE